MDVFCLQLAVNKKLVI